MRRSAALLTVTAAVAASALAACSSSGSSGTTTPASQPATEQASAAATASAASPAAPSAATSPGAASQSGVATSLDPCQIVPASEASALAGVTYGAGKEEPNGTDGKRCVYGSETTHVFSVIVGQAATAADADSYWSQEKSDAQAALTKQVPAGVKFSEQTQDVSGLADRAAVADGSVSMGGESIAASAIYLLKGAVFLSFSDVVVSGSAPTATALEAEAQKALPRLP